MARGKTKLVRIENRRSRKESAKKRMQGLIKKTHELAILCNMATCIMFYCRDTNKMITWPSPEVARSLFKKYFALPDVEQNRKALDEESYLKTNIKKIEKKLANYRKVRMELEMDHLIFQLLTSRRLEDLSKTEVDNLIKYSNNKTESLKKDIDSKSRRNTMVNQPNRGAEISNVASEWGWNGFQAFGSEDIYLMDQWFDLEAPNHSYLPYNMEPSDDIGESSESGGVNDDA